MEKPRYRRTADGRTLYLGDGFQNVVANLGTPRDKALFGRYVEQFWSDADLAAAYRNSWLAKKIVDLLPGDAVSKWRQWQADKDQVNKLEAEEKRLGLVMKTKDALISARLFGFAAIYISTGEDDVSGELNVDSIGLGGIQHLTVMSKNHLIPGEAELDPNSENFGQPKTFRMNTDGEPIEIHPSRLVKFYGAKRPIGDIFSSYHMSPKAVGGGAYFSGYNAWGDSFLQAVFEAVKNHDSSVSNVASLIYEANVDVLHIPRLMELLKKPGGEAKVQTYLSSLAAAKGNNGMLVLDGGDTQLTENKSGGTKYERKGASFNGLADLWDRFMIAVSGASGYPATYLFGMAPAGQNSTGESDMRNYARTVSEFQSMDIEPEMSVLDECVIRSALGSRPEEIWYEWRPSFEASQQEKTETGKTVAEIIQILKTTELFPIETLQKIAENAMAETGSLPGLEAAIEELGMGLEEDDGDDTEAALASLGQIAAGPPIDDPTATQEISDAAPRTLYIHRRVLNAEAIIAWAKGQGFETTLPADDLHVTVAFSRKPVDWMKVGESFEDAVRVAEGGPRIMEQFGDAKVLSFASSALSWRHEAIKHIGATWDHPEYQPHITISYDPNSPEIGDIEPYQGEILLGPEVFSEINEDWEEKIEEQ